MINSSTITKLILALAVVFLAGCDSKPASSGNKNGFEIAYLSGDKGEITALPSEAKYNDLLLSNSDNKPTIYSFFSTKCPECIKKIPHLIDMQNRLGDQINLIGVMVEDKPLDEIRDFIDHYSINYRVVVGRGSFLLADAVGGVRMIPALHIYDQQGKYVAHYIGAVSQEMIESRVNALLNKSK